ncbi:MAG: hypothetical protein KKF44_07740, partial [Nanoarchaeota archaeon]|nr:hypothetical protein [Nanoarchaeota archaeon]
SNAANEEIVTKNYSIFSNRTVFEARVKTDTLPSGTLEYWFGYQCQATICSTTPWNLWIRRDTGGVRPECTTCTSGAYIADDTNYNTWRIEWASDYIKHYKNDELKNETPTTNGAQVSIIFDNYDYTEGSLYVDWVKVRKFMWTEPTTTLLAEESVGAQSKNAINTTAGAEPFWTSSSNPQECTNMKLDDICQTTWQVNATGTVNNSYVFYVIYNPINYSSDVNSNETYRINITIVEAVANIAPNVNSIAISPSTANTSTILSCNATVSDSENATMDVEYWWYNNTVLWLWGNNTGVSVDTNTVIATLGELNTTFNETWNCTVRAYDGWDYSDGYNSTTVAILNTVPTHDEPDITPSSPTTAQNLTCNWNNVYDADGHNVTNITNWYKNNNSILRLYYPFEGGSNSTYTKDYSGNSNDGTVVGAVWNRTGGQVGGAYDFNGSLSYIQTALSGETINNFTAEIWTNIDNAVGEQFVWGPSLGSGSNFCAINNLGGLTLRFYADGNYRATVAIAYDKWYHAAVTLDSSNLWTFYVNGTAVATYQDDSTHSNQANADYIFLGHALQGSHDGLIDEVKVYHEALSADQIYANYLAGLAGHNPQIIVSNETSINDEWLCEVTPNDGYVDGTTKNSTVVTILTDQTAAINSIQCAINTTDNWQSCSNLLWNDTLTQIRVNCTSGSTIYNVTFNLTNTPDSMTQFNVDNATSVSGDYWIYDNTDFKISDSGDWNLTVVCLDSGSNEQVNSTQWTVPWGILNASWSTPTANTNVTQYAFSEFASTLTCLQGECGYVNVTLDPVGENWWNSSYNYRKQINISNINESLTVEKGYSVNISVDTQSLITGNKLQADGDDFRIIYYNGTQYEIDRINETGFNLDSTQIWFRMFEEISQGSSNASYFMYYGNTDADNPPDNRTNIYLLWDDFLGSSVDTGIWNTGAGTPTVSGGEFISNAANEEIVTKNYSIFSNRTVFEARVKTDTLPSGTLEYWFGYQCQAT